MGARGFSVRQVTSQPPRFVVVEDATGALAAGPFEDERYAAGIAQSLATKRTLDEGHFSPGALTYDAESRPPRIRFRHASDVLLAALTERD